MAKFEVALLRAAANITTISNRLVRLIEQIVQRLSVEDRESSHGKYAVAARGDLVCALELQKQMIDEYLVLLRSMPVESGSGFPRRRGPAPKSGDVPQSQQANQQSPAIADVPESREENEQSQAIAGVPESREENEQSQAIAGVPESHEESEQSRTTEESLASSTLSSKSFQLSKDLTEREQEIVDLVARGYDNKEISDTLRLGPQTVKNHMRAIFRKTGVSYREELVRYAKNASGSLDPRSLREADLLGDLSGTDST